MADPPLRASTTVRVEHRTTYRFDPPVRLSPHLLRLRPADRGPGATSDHHATVDRPGSTLTWDRGPDGEWVGTLTVPGRAASLEVVVAYALALAPVDPLAGLPGSPAPAGPDAADAAGAAGAGAGTAGAARAAFDVASAAARRVQAALVHVEDHGPHVASVAEIRARGTASCRDASLVLVDELRGEGLRARFVAGHLVRLAGEDDLVAGPWPAVVPAGEDVVAYHAWAEVDLPGVGWVGFDATTGRPTGAGHVPMASGDHPRDTLPVEGRTEPTAVTLTTSHHLVR